MRKKRVEDVRLRCEHWGCDISAAMCAARQHVGKHGWRGEWYAFKPVPKDEYCMSGKCPQGLRVRKYMEDGDMEQIKEYLTDAPATPNVAIATPDVARHSPDPTPVPAASSNSTRTATDAAPTGTNVTVVGCKCRVCLKFLPLDEKHFRVSDKTGEPITTCLACEAKYGARTKPALPKPPAPDGMKMCSVCGQEKPFAEFNRNLSIKDGFDRFCTTCKSTRQKKYRDAVKERRAKGEQKPPPRYALAARQPAPEDKPKPCAIPAPAPIVFEACGVSVPAPPAGTVLVDFSCCPGVLETLEAISREEFRTPAQQILYFLAKNLYAKEAMSGIQSQKA